jgi:hypothetical protein
LQSPALRKIKTGNSCGFIQMDTGGWSTVI